MSVCACECEIDLILTYLLLSFIDMGCTRSGRASQSLSATMLVVVAATVVVVVVFESVEKHNGGHFTHIIEKF